MTNSPDRIVRPAEFFTILGEGRSNGYLKVKKGLLPPPFKIGPQSSGWLYREAVEINRARAAGATEDEQRKLAAQQVEARKAARPQSLAA